jgi:hypothetical protein
MATVSRQASPLAALLCTLLAGLPGCGGSSNTAPGSSGPPTLSGTPAASVQAGTAYTFQPIGSDPSGHALTFSIMNKPAWATFNTATGMLAGTPGGADAGTTSNIVISVSDGTLSASLAVFSITVTQAGSGSATLTWTAPTMNDDGSTLTAFTGYHVVYGTDTNSLNQTSDVANPTVTTATVSGLSSGTWYFAVKIYLADGTESALSNPVSKVIP